MHLVMFDIDGTLTKSNEIDNKCFSAANQKAFNIEYVEIDWTGYKNVTDSGITIEMFERFYKRKPTQDELELLKFHFTKKLKNAFLENKDYCTEIDGAVSVFNSLKNKQDYAVALATGCWLDSAKLKLENAGFNYHDTPLATSDDSIERKEIMLISLERAKRKYDMHNFQTITYIGDGVWDYSASKDLGFNFIGIFQNNDKQMLVDAGAEFLIENFKDYKRFFEILEGFQPD